MRSLDAGASSRARERRRQEDLSFIAWVQSAPLEELVDRLLAYRHTKNVPHWKVVAVARAIDKWNREAGR